MKNAFYFILKAFFVLKDTHRENKPSNKTEALRKNMNVYIWAIYKKFLHSN